MKQTVDSPCVLLRHDQRIWLMYLMPWGLCWRMCVCVFLLWFSTSVVSNSFVTPWIVAGSSVHKISQAGILEWVAISFSRGSSWPGDGTRVSCIASRFFTTELAGEPHACVGARVCVCTFICLGLYSQVYYNFLIHPFYLFEMWLFCEGHVKSHYGYGKVVFFWFWCLFLRNMFWSYVIRYVQGLCRNNLIDCMFYQ